LITDAAGLSLRRFSRATIFDAFASRRLMRFDAMLLPF